MRVNNAITFACVICEWAYWLDGLWIDGFWLDGSLRLFTGGGGGAGRLAVNIVSHAHSPPRST